jgi:hypothetical protein
MSITYTPATNFGAKDSLPTNDPDKVIKGSEFSTEFVAIQTAFGLAAPAASPTFTGTVTISSVDINGGTIDGVTIGGSSAGAITGTTGQFNTSLNVDGTVTADGLTVDLADNAGVLLQSPNDSSTAFLKFGDSTSSDAGSISYDHFTDSLRLKTVNTNRLVLASNGDISFYEDTGTTAKFFWDASAEALGIGTSSPTYALDVFSSGSSIAAEFQSNLSETYITFNDTGTTLGNVRIGSASNQLLFNAGGSEAMRIDSSGNVGIGTSSPATALDVTTAGGGNFVAAFQNTTSATPYGVWIKEPSSAANGYPSLQVTDSTGSNVRLRVDSGTGNVGIGTSSPGSYGKLAVQNGVIAAVSADGFVQSVYSAANTGQVKLSSYNAAGTSFLTFGTGTDVERMRIDSSGNLLVGTTNSSGTAGSGIKLTNPTSPADDGKLMIVGATSTSGQDAFQIYSTSASAYRCFISYAGQIYATSTSITAISDQSLKENIRDLDKGLDTVLALQPRRFDWKNGDGNDIMGFVAQEVQDVLPELVHDYKINETETKLGLKMGDMIPSLVKAIQEQQEIINDLRARVAQLEGV